MFSVLFEVRPRPEQWDAVLTPGDIILLTIWRDRAAADSFVESASLKEGARLRQIRVVRDYGMFDRREAPQYYPDAEKIPADRAGSQASYK